MRPVSKLSCGAAPCSPDARKLKRALSVRLAMYGTVHCNTHIIVMYRLYAPFCFFKNAETWLRLLQNSFFFFLRIDLCVVLSLVAYLLMHEEAS